ncbi:hypothetical protein [Microseira sp. BLCC-F43]|jgi:hypothetical protein
MIVAIPIKNIQLNSGSAIARRNPMSEAVGKLMIDAIAPGTSI